MQPTDYHAKYYSYMLTANFRKEGAPRLARAVMSAEIELRPYQIDAASFAMRPPFGTGVLFADEEGLGKTVEACLALAQYFAEGRRHLIVCVPDWKKDHWRTHLEELFALPVTRLSEHPVKRGVVLITASKAIEKADRISGVSWDLCVIDEAHRVAGSDSFTGVKPVGTVLKHAFKNSRILLLSATPLQKGLVDLYYMLRFVDGMAFGGDVEVFKRKYIDKKTLKNELLERVSGLCCRTLKKHVAHANQGSERAIDPDFSLRQKPVGRASGSASDDWNKLKIKAETDMLAVFSPELVERSRANIKALKHEIENMRKMLFDLTKYKLKNCAVFSEGERAFTVKLSPYEDLPIDNVFLSMEGRVGIANKYSTAHPLAKRLLDDCLMKHTGSGVLTLSAGGGFSAGMSGVFGVWGVTAFSDYEEFDNMPLVCGITSEGIPIAQRYCEVLLQLEVVSCEYAGMAVDSEGNTVAFEYVSGRDKALLAPVREEAFSNIKKTMRKRMENLMQSELKKLRRYYEDQLYSLDLRRDEMKKSVAVERAGLDNAASLAERYAIQRKLVQNELKKRRIEQDKAVAEADIEKDAKQKLEAVQSRATLRFRQEELFVVRYIII